ncbi:hypothetical protein BASA61_008140 [Batrachochytrium salamandrivorans]|nr:hypothetical protein BASA61_008126 [Batrachochytrium salamandrivorans]KAH6583170.1 hypothetical protein BASA61_008140 [Batrachochytrium salamandrivorans]
MTIIRSVPLAPYDPARHHSCPFRHDSGGTMSSPLSCRAKVDMGDHGRNTKAIDSSLPSPTQPIPTIVATPSPQIVNPTIYFGSLTHAKGIAQDNNDKAARRKVSYFSLGERSSVGPMTDCAVVENLRPRIYGCDLGRDRLGNTLGVRSDGAAKQEQRRHIYTGGVDEVVPVHSRVGQASTQPQTLYLSRYSDHHQLRHVRGLSLPPTSQSTSISAGLEQNSCGVMSGGSMIHSCNVSNTSQPTTSATPATATNVYASYYHRNHTLLPPSPHSPPQLPLPPIPTATTRAHLDDQWDVSCATRDSNNTHRRVLLLRSTLRRVASVASSLQSEQQQQSLLSSSNYSYDDNHVSTYGSNRDYKERCHNGNNNHTNYHNSNNNNNSNRYNNHMPSREHFQIHMYPHTPTHSYLPQAKFLPLSPTPTALNSSSHYRYRNTRQFSTSSKVSLQPLNSTATLPPDLSPSDTFYSSAPHSDNRSFKASRDTSVYSSQPVKCPSSYADTISADLAYNSMADRVSEPDMYSISSGTLNNRSSNLNARKASYTSEMNSSATLITPKTVVTGNLDHRHDGQVHDAISYSRLPLALPKEDSQMVSDTIHDVDDMVATRMQGAGRSFHHTAGELDSTEATSDIGPYDAQQSVTAQLLELSLTDMNSNYTLSRDDTLTAQPHQQEISDRYHYRSASAFHGPVHKSNPAPHFRRQTGAISKASPDHISNTHHRHTSSYSSDVSKQPYTYKSNRHTWWEQELDEEELSECQNDGTISDGSYPTEIESYGPRLSPQLRDELSHYDVQVLLAEVLLVIHKAVHAVHSSRHPTRSSTMLDRLSRGSGFFQLVAPVTTRPSTMALDMKETHKHLHDIGGSVTSSMTSGQSCSSPVNAHKDDGLLRRRWKGLASRVKSHMSQLFCSKPTGVRPQTLMDQYTRTPSNTLTLHPESSSDNSVSRQKLIILSSIESANPSALAEIYRDASYRFSCAKAILSTVRFTTVQRLKVQDGICEAERGAEKSDPALRQHLSTDDWMWIDRSIKTHTSEVFVDVFFDVVVADTTFPVLLDKYRSSPWIV